MKRYELSSDEIKYFEAEFSETLGLLKTMTLIPAPSHFEDERAEFVKGWLEAAGARGVYIDGAKNVIYKIDGEISDEAVVFMAHTDTVFPKDTPLIWREEDGKLFCPSIGDDTCSLAVMMSVIRYVTRHALLPRRTVIFVANACEEGLGNLKGSKQIVSDFGSILKEFYTLDGKYQTVVTRCVGSHRYRIRCTSEGGHSYSAFGNTNAIAELAKLISALYEITVPEKSGTKTTYNVGMIEGGTSVNTIAQFAEMLYEYRSDDRECLDIMKSSFFGVLEDIKKNSRASFDIELVGDRPCDGEVDKACHRQMIEKVQAICEKYTGVPCVEKSGSTDCNSASSAGIPSVCLGVYCGGGAHTREEWVERDSIIPGLKIAAELILDYFHN